MASRTEYSVVLALHAVDAATAPIRSVVASLAGLRARVVAFGRENLGTARLVNQLRAVRMQAAAAAAHLRGMLAPAIAATGLASVGSIAGLFGLAKAAANAGNAVYEQGERWGMAAERVKEWQFAASRVGIDNDTLAASMMRLTKNVGEAVNDTGKAKDVFKALGVSLTDAGGKVRSTDAIMLDVATAMGKIHDASQRNAVSSALFGRSGVALGVMFKEGRGQLEAYFAQSRTFSTMTDEQAVSAHQFSLALDDSERAAKGLGLAIGTKLFPILTPMIQDVTEWLKANKALIATEVEQFVRGFADSLRTVDWQSTVRGTFAFISGIQQAIRFIGGWQVALGAVALTIVAGPLMATAQLTASVGRLGIELALVSARMAIAFAGSVVGTIINVVTALRAGVGVVMALNFAMAANPIGLIVTGITLLVGLGVTLYHTWEPFRKMVDGILEKVMKVVHAATGWVGKKLGLDLGGENKGSAPEEGNDGAPPGTGPENPSLPGMKIPDVGRPSLPPGLQQPAAPLPAKADVTVKILSEAPAKIEKVTQSGGNLTVTTDLEVGKGKAGTD